MRNIIVDAGPFIHLSQIKQLKLLKKFPVLYTTVSVISEIKPGGDIPTNEICSWRNLKIVSGKEKSSPKIEKVIKRFALHRGERDVLILAGEITKPVILTDDLSARSAAENLNLEVHGTVGVITYAFYSKWISFKEAQKSLILLNERSSLFITSAIIERAIQELKKHLP